MQKKWQIPVYGCEITFEKYVDGENNSERNSRSRWIDNLGGEQQQKEI
jgi:hypothetical protein